MAHPTIQRVPSTRELRQRFPDLEKVSVTMVRRSFNVTTHTARRVLRLGLQVAADEAAAPVRKADAIAELMCRFNFSESEAEWAYENVGMPE